MDFSYSAKIYGYECDVYGHLNNANYQHLFEAARAEMLDQLGLSLSELLSQDIHIYVRKITIEYIKGIPMGSEVSVTSHIATLSRVKSLWLQEIRANDGTLMSRAAVEGVFVSKGKPVRIPKEMAELLRKGCKD